jgi:hypothetical protein
MAFQITGVSNSTEYKGGNKVVKVREYHVLSLQSETYFEFRREIGTPGYTNPKPAPQQLSDRIEAVLGLPDVTDVLYSQDVTQAGRLQDRMETFYRTQDGSISGSVESSLAQFGPNFTGNQISAEIAAGGDQLGS